MDHSHYRRDFGGRRFHQIGAIRMLRKRFAPRALLVGMFFASLGGCHLAPKTGGIAPGIEVLSKQSTAFRDEFNRNAGKLRLVFIIDPSCPTCLRGLADLDRDVLRPLPPSTPVYIVYLPVIGGKESQIRDAASLVHHANVRHYWNPSGSFGETIGEQLQLRREGQPVFAWDVWMVYGPEAVWKDRPPQPRLMMHQLPSIDPAPNVKRLDSAGFAQAVEKIEREQSAPKQS